MREILFQGSGRTNILKSQWLRVKEAAKYCGMSIEAFREHSGDLPRGGDSKLELFQVVTLDTWMVEEDILEIGNTFSSSGGKQAPAACLQEKG